MVKVKVQGKIDFRVRSIFVEPLVGFINNSEQISRMMSRCAVRTCNHGRLRSRS